MLITKSDKQYTAYSKGLGNLGFYLTIQELIKEIVDTLPNTYLTLDSTLSEKETKMVKDYYNELFLKQNPNAVLMLTESQVYKTVHTGDSGLDLYTPETITIPAKSTGTINFGVKCQANSSFWLLPRSSIGKTPLRLANSIGLIDSGYRGELKAMVDNTSDVDYTIEAGTRLFQIAFPDLRPMYSVQVTHLTTTTRGEGGFGSTGTK